MRFKTIFEKKKRKKEKQKKTRHKKWSWLMVNYSISRETSSVEMGVLSLPTMVVADECDCC